MKVEIWILIISIIITIILLWKFIPRNKILDAHISFLFMQVLTWLFGSIVSEEKLIVYPVRFMEYAYRVSFTFEYFIFPAVSAIYNVNFHRLNNVKYKVGYMFFFPSIISGTEAILEKYTDVIKYIHWAWYWSWITIFITLQLSYWYYLWFMKKMKVKFTIENEDSSSME
ncbi:CBO0543 family protein [Bacillus sp. JJ1764]|uniref:CBO0543 family protein n=1 Tax=Bacillus sp. JJ1764 TaxID=3122964 RepID=UPI002FFE30C3